MPVPSVNRCVMMYLDEEHSKIYIKPQMLKIIIGIIHKTVQIINSIAS